MSHTFRVVPSLEAISRASWNALVTEDLSPFVEWDWLRHLEVSESVSPASGWYPSHATLWQENTLVAACPLYLRVSSHGEFVFDHVWQQAASVLDTPYFPKLLGASPFTPIQAFSFLHHPSVPIAPFLDCIETLREECEAPLLQYNFVSEDAMDALASRGFSAWHHNGFLWKNEGFASFDDYLARFRKNQRRNILRERRSVADQNLVLRMHGGLDVPHRYFELMYEYYARTNEKFDIWAARYLTKAFFGDFPEEAKHRVVFAAAYGSKQDADALRRPVALAFMLRKKDTLFGRYWGAESFYPQLHFSLCYYLPIEWCISHKLRYFDPGIGSEHKMRRGFSSVTRCSMHYFAHRGLHSLFAEHIGLINEEEDRYRDQLNTAIPIKACQHRMPPGEK